MAPSRRQTSGRSPLVNQQRQITSFFSKPAPSSSTSPSSVLPKQKFLKSVTNPNPNPNPNPNTVSRSSLSPVPATPSPVQSELKKPLLVIGESPSPARPTPPPPSKSYGEEVVGKNVRVYWPLDKRWYDGCVRSFDKGLGKHFVEYEDGEEEKLDLGKEKIEWVGGESCVGRFKRLRRGSSTFKRVVIEDDEEMENVVAGDEDKDNVEDGDDSSDEDWEKKAEKEASDSGEEDLDLEDEKDADEAEVEEEVKTPDGKRSAKNESRKRKASGGHKLKSGEKLASGKKIRTSGGIGSEAFKAMIVEPVNEDKVDKAVSGSENLALAGEVLERFGARDARKLHFLGKERRDAKRRHPGDENYDPRTLYLPPDFVKSLSGGQRQWWEFKSKHMDKVIFFKMGKFYELFEMDAHVGAKELDLQYMKGEQPHCGFPEKNFSLNVENLARKGYRVLVVEQTETPEQLEQRRKVNGSKDKVVKREVCAVVTKGTLTEGEMLLANPDASYLMALTEEGQSSTDQSSNRSFGVCVVDVATSRVLLGQFSDDAECSALCCLLSEIRPAEIIKPAKMLSSETEKAITRHTRNVLVNELEPFMEFWDASKTLGEIESLYKRISGKSNNGSSGEITSPTIKSPTDQSKSSFLPKMLTELASSMKSSNLALSALGGSVYYLRQAFLDETLLRYAKYESLPCFDFSELARKQHMVLDAAALENLEIFENSRDGGSSGTLYSQLDHCVTASGKRLLKTWLARPLYCPRLVKERQDALASLRGENLPYSMEFRKALSKLPDMERLLARVFSSGEANGRNSKKVVLYEDAAKKQLQEFILALRGCETIVQACSAFSINLENVPSSKLKYLLTPGQGLPDITTIVGHFKDAFDWVEAHSSGRVVPHEGADEEYDSVCKTVKDIVSSLKKHLKEQNKLLGNTSITYVTVGKEEYLLEVPENLQGRVPQDYELRSSKKGFFRYWTPTIKNLLRELSEAESEKESALKSILHRLIGRFCEHHNKWRQMVSAVAELDVLISLAIASDFFEGSTCRPVISSSSSSVGVPCISARGLGHPVLRSDSLDKGAFVPNDVTIGGVGHASFILLTGPNMGGKSTLLRQVCLAVILAQVGADVPAERFELSPVDRIFVRMGAKDHIMAGQSTFLTELQETASMLSSATQNSLVALDELGRGTATSDGQAIAESVLEHFIRNVQCRGMFSTHYHRLAVDYQRDPKVSLCHMGCRVGEGAGGVEEVTFLYRLTAGACPKSYGVNVARLAGLPDSVLERAAAKSREFEAVYGKHHTDAEYKMADLTRRVISVVSNLKCHNSDDDDDSLDSLTQLKNVARKLLFLQD